MNKREKVGEKTIYYNSLSIEARDILEKIKNNEYVMGKTLQKKDNREVRLLTIDGKKYVLKRERGRGLIDLIFRTTLNNVRKLKEKKFNNIYDVEIIAEKRRGMGVEETLILAPYIEGREPREGRDYNKVMESLRELHSMGYFHGDSKPKNFICNHEGAILIDTKLKRSKFGVGKWKDVARLQKRTPEKLDLTRYFGDYRKNIAYYLAVAWVYKKELFRGVRIYQEVF
ncbi:LPS biosynthesis protein [Propionigenium maris DSM 9537]|uniref:LPS biosynthesis protein n=1 Tax=Propionigenium maris DSM 9537 TaxID=1123000 RepID=A0A9W6GLX0_9FUSO|nr:lipopolysaccharide core heptose(II) kinase RfaY [Propionigenium maris]GLI56355.1 LPS biosynthesis protein [Propionigenium maris DSM 9537]